MMVTTWDGHLRLDRVSDGSVLLTLLTGEPTTEAGLRAGLAAAFVTDDPDGPPARVRAVLDGGSLPPDVADLVGSRISEAVAGLRSGGSGAWLRLDLSEVDDLAEAWAPYRIRVLLPEPAPPVVGSWADGLWTALDLRPATAPGPTPVFRGGPVTGPADDGGHWGDVVVPVALAAACGCDTTLTWRSTGSPSGVVLELQVLVVGTGTDELLAGLDVPDAVWVPLRDVGGGTLRARLTLPGPDVPALRLRTRTGRT